MYPLLKVFLDILRFRAGPQMLPASELLLIIVLGLHFLLGVVFFSSTLAFGSAAFAAMVCTLLVVLLVQAALYLRGVGHRFVQTATAMAGTEFLLALLALPFSASPSNGDIEAVIALLLVGWSFVVAAHIFRHALGVDAWTGFAAAVFYMFISNIVASLFMAPGA